MTGHRTSLFGMPLDVDVSAAHHGDYLSFPELISHYRDAHFSVLLDESERSASLDSGFIPSKLAELFALRRPILCIGNPRARAAQLIESTRAGVCVVNEAAAIELALLAIADGIAGNRIARDLPESLAEQIDIRGSERAFQALLESLLP